MFDRSHSFPSGYKACEPATSYQEVCLALEADFLSPTGKVAVIVTAYVEEAAVQGSASDEIAQAAYQVRRALREYQSARKSTVFGLGVSDRTKAAKTDLSERLDRLRALSPPGASHR